MGEDFYLYMFQSKILDQNNIILTITHYKEISQIYVFPLETIVLYSTTKYDKSEENLLW